MTVSPTDWLLKALRDHASKVFAGAVFAAGATVLVWIVSPIAEVSRVWADVPDRLDAIEAAITGNAQDNVDRDTIRDTAVASLVTDVSTLTGAVAANEVALTGLQATLNSLLPTVTALQQPDSVFEVGPNSGAIGGYCVDGERCEILAEVFRTPEGMDCDIIPGGVEYFVMDMVTRQRRQVTLIDPPAPRNISGNTDLIFAFIMPRGLVTEPDRGVFVFIAKYTQCTPNSGGLVVSDESDPIDFLAYRTRADVPR